MTTATNPARRQQRRISLWAIMMFAVYFWTKDHEAFLVGMMFVAANMMVDAVRALIRAPSEH